MHGNSLQPTSNFIYRSTPFRLGTESPDLVSMEFKEGNRTREDLDESHRTAEDRKLLGANTLSSSSCISDTSMGILNFKTSIEGTTPSIFKGRNVVNWSKKNTTHQPTENFDASIHNQMKIHSLLHQPPTYNQQSMSQETHQSSTNLIPPYYHSHHNEFNQNDIPSVSSNYTIQSTSDSSTRTSQTYSTTNPHMYL